VWKAAKSTVEPQPPAQRHVLLVGGSRASGEEEAQTRMPGRVTAGRQSVAAANWPQRGVPDQSTAHAGRQAACKKQQQTKNQHGQTKGGTAENNPSREVLERGAPKQQSSPSCRKATASPSSARTTLQRGRRGISAGEEAEGKSKRRAKPPARQVGGHQPGACRENRRSSAAQHADRTQRMKACRGKGPR